MDTIKMLKDKIQDLQDKKYDLQNLIQRIENDINAINHSILETCVNKCGGHDFESFREPGLYGETYYVCKICGIENY